MKKIFSAVIGLLMIGSATFAQTTKPADNKMPVHKSVVKAPEHKVVTHETVTEKHHEEVKHLKKDGTPDKRFTENQHLKKDGTPDKRFKTNKAKAPVKDKMAK